MHQCIVVWMRFRKTKTKKIIINISLNFIWLVECRSPLATAELIYMKMFSLKFASTLQEQNKSVIIKIVEIQRLCLQPLDTYHQLTNATYIRLSVLVFIALGCVTVRLSVEHIRNWRNEKKNAFVFLSCHVNLKLDIFRFILRAHGIAHAVVWHTTENNLLLV